MNDLERIKQIEEILGVPFSQVEDRDSMTTSNAKKNTYIVNETGNVTKIKFDSLSLHLLQPEIFKDFQYLNIVECNNTQSEDYIFLKEAKQINTLIIASDSFTDSSVLKELNFLKELILVSGKLTNLSGLTELIGLVDLMVVAAELNDIASLEKMKQLRSLLIFSTQLTDISVLKELPNLVIVDLRSDQLADVSSLKELKNLKYLHLISEQLADISSLTELVNIESLNLRCKQLTDVLVLKKLVNLKKLYLDSNQLSDLSFLTELTKLELIELKNNNITDAASLSELVNLNSLNLSNNKITDGSFLNKLVNLTWLDLSSNELTDMIFLKELVNLKWLYLGTNRIETLPENITETNMEITLENKKYDTGYLNLADNPIKTPPLYLVQRGKEAIKKYFQKGEPYLDSIQIENYFSLESISVVNLADKKEIYFLGENGDGKTILLQAIALALKGDQKFGIISDVLKDNTTFLTEQKESTVEKNLSLGDFLFGNSNIKDESVEFYQHARSNKKNTQQQKEIIISEPLLEATDSFGYKKQYREGNIDFPHSNVYAYGINRVFNKNDETREDENKEVYLSLFDHRYGLTDPVQWLKDIRLLTLDNKEKGLPEPTITVSRAKQLLSELLSKEIDIKISGTSVTFSEKGSAPVSFRQLSDGYKSVINWLCDLLSRLSQNQPHVNKLEDYYGIVLVDEIGVYLHPRLQFTLVGMLRKKFKKIQWIFTTHSPIITLGASEDAVFYKLYKENGKTQLAGPVNGISGMTANSLITSILWRLDEFTTQGTNINQINSDDYIYKVIHDAIRERIKKNINLSDKDTAQMVQKLLDNLKTLESKMTQDLESDISAANELIDA